MNYLSQLSLSFFSHQFILVICVFIVFFISIIFIYLFFYSHNNTIFNSNSLLEFFWTITYIVLVLILLLLLVYLDNSITYELGIMYYIKYKDWLWGSIFSIILLILLNLIFLFLNRIYRNRKIMEFFKCYASFCSRHPIFYSIIVLLLYAIICMFVGHFPKEFLPYFLIIVFVIFLNKLIIILFCFTTHHPYPFTDVAYQRLHSFYFYINKCYSYCRFCIIIPFLALAVTNVFSKLVVSFF